MFGHVPKRAWAGFVQYTFPPQTWGTLIVNGSFVREGPKDWLGDPVQNVFSSANKYTKYDARVALVDAFGIEGLSLAAVGKNITDRAYRCCQGIDFNLWQGGGFGDPRFFYFEVGFEYGGI